MSENEAINCSVCHEEGAIEEKKGIFTCTNEDCKFESKILHRCDSCNHLYIGDEIKDSFHLGCGISICEGEVSRLIDKDD